ncbi:MAG: hypothetical protein AAGB11_04870 [Pseudomonadota bacterium]
MDRDTSVTPWPKQYAGILPVIRREWDVKGEILLTRQLGGGKSGALVFFVDISTRSFAGQAILKLDHPHDPEDQEQHEAALFARAIDDAPRFASAHLPKLLHTAHHDHQMAILSKIAGRGLEYVEPWFDCQFDRKVKSVRKASLDLLEVWNANYRMSDGLQMPQDLLRGWLDYRIDPTRGGRIHEFVEQECGISPGMQSMTYEGRWYPNPLAFIDGAETAPKQLRLRGALGHCHGDFHGLNLLIGRRENAGFDYYLIDLAMYEGEQFLFYDHAYFELTLLLRSRGDVPPSTWAALVDQLNRFDRQIELHDLRTDDVGLVELVLAVRDGPVSWIEKYEANRLSFLESQMLLARIAAGLNFTHKRISKTSRQMAFLYAAANLKEYLELHRLDWQKDGPVFISGDPSQHPQPTEFTAEADRSSERSALVPLKPSASTSYPSSIRRQGLAVYLGLGLTVVLVVLAVLIGRETFWGDDTRVSTTGTPESTEKSVAQRATESKISLAVLPFRNISPGQDDEFADGLSIDVAGFFAQTGTFRMPGNTSTFQFKGDDYGDARTVGEALNVEYILEGTIRKNNNNLRISVDLVRTEDDFLVNSHAFDEKVDDVFAAQKRIAGEIGNMFATLISADDQQLNLPQSDDPSVYQLFLRAQHLLQRPSRGLADAMTMLEEALEKSPNFAAGWANLSLVYDLIPTYVNDIDGKPVNAAAYYRNAREAALRAEDINPDLPVVHHALGTSYTRGNQWIEAEKEFEAGLLAAGDDATIMQAYAGMLYSVGKHQKSAELLRQAQQVDPYNQLLALNNAFVALQGHEGDAASATNESTPQEENEHNDLAAVHKIFENSRRLRPYALRLLIDNSARMGEIDQVRDLIDRCGDCASALRTTALNIIDEASSEPAETVFEKYKDSILLGYDFIYSFGGDELALKAFRYYGFDGKYNPPFSSVPWSLVDQIGDSAEFFDVADDMGLTNYWSERGDPDNCTVTEDKRLSCTHSDSE